MKKVLITGINGFLGSHLAKGLKDKFEIIGLANSIDNLYRLHTESFKVYSAKKDSLESIFIENEIFSIIHVATVYKRSDDPILPLLNTNILLPIQLTELAIKFKVKLFINTDTFFNNKTYSYSYLPDYTLSKRHSLEWIKMLGVSSECKVVNMKIFHMYGKHDSPNKFIPFILEKIRSNNPFLEMTPGEQTRDFIYIKDVVNAYNIVLNSSDDFNSYQEFEIGTGQSSSIKEVAKLIKEITQSTTELKFGAFPYREGEIMESVVEKFDLNPFGWHVKYTLEEGLRDYIL